MIIWMMRNTPEPTRAAQPGVRKGKGAGWGWEGVAQGVREGVIRYVVKWLQWVREGRACAFA